MADVETSLILPGMPGADFVALTPAIQADLIRRRTRFVLRYVVPPNYTSIGKDYKAWETGWYHEHGIAPLANFERSHDDATRSANDAAAGRANGRTTGELAHAFGFPLDAPVFVSVDQDIWSGNIGEAEDYVRGFAEAVAPYPLGIYGDDDIAYRCRDLEPVFWRANALGWDGERRPVQVHIQQHRPVAPGLDPNTALQPFPAWLPNDDTATDWIPGGTMLHTHQTGGARLLDTRTAEHGNRPGRLAVGEVVKVKIPGVDAGAGPVVGKSAIVKTTVVAPSAPGFVKVSGEIFGEVGGGNFGPEQYATNSAWLAPIVNGSIAVKLEAATAHLIVDLLGVVD